MPHVDVLPQVHIDTRDAAQKLVESSMRLEKYAERLNRLTEALIGLTLVLFGVGLTDILVRIYLHV